MIAGKNVGKSRGMVGCRPEKDQGKKRDRSRFWDPIGERRKGTSKQDQKCRWRKAYKKT